MRSLIKPLVRSNFKPVIFNGISKAIEYVAQTDGATQYWQLSEPIPLEVGDRVEFYFISSGGNLSSFVMDSTDRSAFIFNNSGMIQRSSPLGFLDINGVRVQNQVTPFPNIGVTNYATVDMDVSPATLEFFGCEYRQDRGYFYGFIYNIKVIRNGVVIHEIPLTNKAQGATQLATVGNVNAFMPNYTESVWRDKSTL